MFKLDLESVSEPNIVDIAFLVRRIRIVTIGLSISLNVLLRESVRVVIQMMRRNLFVRNAVLIPDQIINFKKQRKSHAN